MNGAGTAIRDGFAYWAFATINKTIMASDDVCSCIIAMASGGVGIGARNGESGFAVITAQFIDNKPRTNGREQGYVSAYPF